MTRFKIGQFVLLTDPQGIVSAARVEGFEAPRRWRVLRLGDGAHATVPEGDIALPGEDKDVADREANKFAWRKDPERRATITDGHGGSFRPHVDADNGDSAALDI